jgi:hypothetical protein
MQSDWSAVQEKIGEDFSTGEILWGADAVEKGAIRRLLEPLEYDCPLHYDSDTAREAGFEDITMPYTGILSFIIPPLWAPGERIFTSEDRNAQPEIQALRPVLPKEAPPFSAYFATDIEIDFLREVVAGERLGRRGHRLVACSPKETRVGKGAFLTFETDIVTEQLQVVARMRSGLFCYEPFGDN